MLDLQSTLFVRLVELCENHTPFLFDEAEREKLRKGYQEIAPEARAVVDRIRGEEQEERDLLNLTGEAAP